MRRRDIKISPADNVEPRVALCAYLTGDCGPTPLPLIHQAGTIEKDFIQASLMSIKLVTNRFVIALRDGAITGWMTYPVSIQGVRVKQEYSGLAITGRCGPIQRHNSIGSADSTGPYKFSIGLKWDPDTWDGSDLFVPTGTTFLVATARTIDVMRKRKIKGVMAKPVKDVRIPPSLGRG